jgi:alkanesulfonate monooxygenase SsuD/methylene tetrahydromethanopterin reductase-like flavin-dependent oxidoreductase (luciferase family)
MPGNVYWALSRLIQKRNRFHMTQNTKVQRMKLGIALETAEGYLDGRTPTFHDLQEMAQAAEQIGLDSLWLADHLIYRLREQEEYGIWEAFTFLSALAAVTTHIALGPLVACTSFRSPALLAKMTDALDEISGGRFILGLGAGWHQPEYEAFGYPFDHLASRFEEALQVIVPLLHEGHVDFQGQYYQVHNCVPRPRMFQLIARYADAWNTAWHVESTVVKERYEQFKKVCAAVGRDPATIELTAGTVVRLLESSKDATAEKAISGSSEEIAIRLQSFADVGVSHLIVVLDPPGVAGIEQFGRVVELLRQG